MTGHEPDRQPDSTDAIIIGAGPAALFAVFELGLLDLKAHVIDILDRPGGQCAELYPDKPIYDIPGVPVVTGEELIQQLMEQIRPFNPVMHFGEMAVELSQQPGGAWRIKTDLGTIVEAPVVVISAGPGSFQPKRPPIAGIEAYEGQSVFYAVRDRNRFSGKKIIIVGGGDSALDWALNLHESAARITLIHRREDFRAAESSVKAMKELIEAKALDFYIGQVKHLTGDSGQLSAVTVETKTGDSIEVPCDALLAFFGLTMKLGAIADFGIDLHENRIPVDTEKFQTNRPGVFAIGDICDYPGKLKLILSGFHEAALMAHAAFHIARPNQKLKFQHTSASSALQEKLGVR